MENPHSILKKVFGYDNFRPGQEEIVSRLLAGQDVLDSAENSEYGFADGRAATAQKLVTPEHITVLNPSERTRSRI